MIESLCANFHPLAHRRASHSGHGAKTTSSTLGSTRSRLIQVLRHLGFYREGIEARLRDEREIVLLVERRRLERAREEQEVALRAEELRIARLEEEREAARLAESSRVAQLKEREQLARAIEERRVARLVREQIAYQAMTDDQKAAWRLEEEIVSWVSVDEADS
jgi:hypothetical protein